VRSTHAIGNSDTKHQNGLAPKPPMPTSVSTCRFLCMSNLVYLTGGFRRISPRTCSASAHWAVPPTFI